MSDIWGGSQCLTNGVSRNAGILVPKPLYCPGCQASQFVWALSLREWGQEPGVVATCPFCDLVVWAVSPLEPMLSFTWVAL